VITQGQEIPLATGRAVHGNEIILIFINMETIKKSILLEDNKQRNEIRTIVRDIVQVFKDNDDGEFYLPEEVNGKHYYDLPKLGIDLSVELIIQPDENVDNYLMDANYFRDDHIIVIGILYNTDNKQQSLYGIIGELNELIAHELRHVYQKRTGMYDLDQEEPEEPYLYYTQDHEIDAQVYGFKRMSQITRKPFNYLVRNWFDTHQDLHGLDKEEVEKVIQIIIDTKNKTNS